MILKACITPSRCPPTPLLVDLGQALSKAALGDKDEWVGTIARAVGAFEGRLDLEAVVAGSSAVRARTAACSLDKYQAQGSRLGCSPHLGACLGDMGTCGAAPGARHAHGPEAASQQREDRRVPAPGGNAMMRSFPPLCWYHPCSINLKFAVYMGCCGCCQHKPCTGQ